MAGALASRIIPPCRPGAAEVGKEPAELCQRAGFPEQPADPRGSWSADLSANGRTAGSRKKKSDPPRGSLICRWFPGFKLAPLSVWHTARKQRAISISGLGATGRPLAQDLGPLVALRASLRGKGVFPTPVIGVGFFPSCDTRGYPLDVAASSLRSPF